MLLVGATLPDGTTGDVRLSGDSIAEVGRTLARRDPRPRPAGSRASGEDVVDLRGYLLLPALAEPHAHLDKALTADRVPNRTGDLFGAIEAWVAYRPQLTVDDIVERATRAALLLLGNGTTAIRTHVDVAADVGLRCVEALSVVKRGAGRPARPADRGARRPAPRRIAAERRRTRPCCATPWTPVPTSSAAARTSTPSRWPPSTTAWRWPPSGSARSTSTWTRPSTPRCWASWSWPPTSLARRLRATA